MEETSVRQRRARVGLFVLATLLVGTAAVLPFALRSMVKEIAEPPEGQVFTLLSAPGVALAPDHSRLHVSLIDLDEARLRVTLHVSGHHVCADRCTDTERIIFFSHGTTEAATAGMPPSAKVDLITPQAVVAETVTLPISGHPSRYPFDTYQLRLGVALARVLPDGAVRPDSRAGGAGRLWMTIQDLLPREIMSEPATLDPDSAREVDDPYELQVLALLEFERPLHARLLVVLLVVLIAAAAACAVLMARLHDLVISSGALVLGVWGIRNLLTPGTTYRTIVDLALSAVVIFLLGAITVRALQLCYAESDLHLGRRRPEPVSEPTHQHAPPGNECDYADCPNPIASRCVSCRQAFCPRHIDAGPAPRCDSCGPPAEAATATERQPGSRGTDTWTRP